MTHNPPPFLSQIGGAIAATSPPPPKNSDVRLSNPADLGSGALAVLGSDDDGWMRIQISLEALLPAAGGADAGWNRIVFRDVSGARRRLSGLATRCAALSSPLPFSAAAATHQR